MEGADAAKRAPRFGLMLALLALLAFALREHYVLSAIVAHPIRGDIREYVAYAWNLAEHGVFGKTPPPMLPVPDDYRSPGYPWLIALAMRVFGQAPAWDLAGPWYPWVLQLQVLLGTATVVMTALLARYWLSATWSIVAGLLLACWPHHVAATNTLLTEVLFGCLLLGGLLAFARAWTTQRMRWFVATGAVFASAALVNPVALLFVPCLAALGAWHRRRRAAVVLLAVFLVPVLALGVRNAGLPDQGSGGDRASLNFVQGSWPDYHAAATRLRSGDPLAIAVTQEIDAEQRTLRDDPIAGLRRIGARMADAPAFYAKWYAGKPWALWGWKIRIGASDIAFLEVQRSPFERMGVLRALRVAYRTLNPLLTTLMLASALVLAWRGLRHAESMPAAATGLLAVYLTAVHVVLQAEPRYAVAYRGIEAVLVVAALAWAAGKVRKRPSLGTLNSTGRKRH
ncbi:4-amino-4-deoxy-L-arabinose transferase [Lysobacter dokdonensis DS-58]|uniref:4-amino-4-deoxy-L-arabinose transferase n=1 Tax=Lysobacter dokdonensis DS-58 TaxID=1300345 RepID=A0A0A2WJE4_9GAMM|nr:glycosyltransferase family 39 protein [Lysobacter dokdonensis]KGQ18842.1 4-amino-4-deoxy-L-arabinose transferase [Lysobacter dokdonensis DS-58]